MEKQTQDDNRKIVVYHNNLADLALKDFTSKERDLLMALCCRLKDCGTQQFTLSFREIRSLSNYKRTSNKALAESLSDMVDKLLGLKMREYGENGEIRVFVFFQEFDIYPNEGMLKIAVSNRFEYLVNEFSRNFTSFELENHTSLRSSYSKEVYRQLMRYKDKGTWWVSADKFHELIGIPDNYRIRDVKTKILPLIEKELSPLFEHFEINVEK